MLMMILAAAWVVFLLPPLLRWLRSGQVKLRRGYSSRRFGGLVPVSPRLAERGAMVAPVVALRPNLRSVDRRYSDSYTRGSKQLLAYRSSVDARHRRRRVLVVLVAAALFSFVFAVYFGGPALLMHLVIDALLLAYVMALLQHQRRSEERLKLIKKDECSSDRTERWSTASGARH